MEVSMFGRTNAHRLFAVLGVGMAVLGLASLAAPASAQAPGEGPANVGPQVVELTLERMVDLTLSRSYQIRRLNLEIQRDQFNLHAERARLKSSVDLDLTVPAFRLTSEPKWNSDLQRDEIIQEHTRRWEGELSVRQPLILFGYPTNGYFSFNNRMYRYNQIDDDGNEDVRYYNRYYLSYTQPLFQPNGLKNDLEQAEMSLEGTQLEFYEDVVGIVDNVAEDYFDLFEERVTSGIYADMAANLQRALGMAQEMAQEDSTRALDVDQIQIELANALENVQSAESSYRLDAASVKRDLGLADTDSIAVDPVFELAPVSIDMDQAIEYAMELTPRMRQLGMSLRNSEIRLEDTKSRGGFRMNLNMSYGRERMDEEMSNLWVDPDNSYTMNVSAFVPVWDWGERKARIASSEIGIQQSRLRIEEAEIQIVSDVRNEVLNVRDREARTMAMRDNVELAREVTETSFQRYQDGVISALDLILSLRREADTAENFLETYLGWRGSLRRLQEMTFFDFERGIPVLERFQVQDRLPSNGILSTVQTLPAPGNQGRNR
jgi:outer membrane protein TolC